MTPEQEALVKQVLDSSEMTEHLLLQPQFELLWKQHAWGHADQMHLQTHIPEKSKRTKSGWPPHVEADPARYISFRVRELLREHDPAAPVEPPRPSGTNVERLRALINQGDKQS